MLVGDVLAGRGSHGTLIADEERIWLIGLVLLLLLLGAAAAALELVAVLSR